MNLLIYILIVHLYIAFKLWWDHRARTRDKRVINHRTSGAVNVLLYTSSALVLLVPQYGWWVAGCILWSSFFWKWLLFDLGYNIIFKNKWSYCGNWSWIDKKVDLLDGKDDQDCALGLFLKIVGIAIGIAGLWL